MINDTVKATGTLHVVRRNEAGEVTGEWIIKNLVVTAGRNYIASRMVGVAAAAASHMALGTGATAPALGDTALQTEIARVALSANSSSANVVTWSTNFPAGTGTGTLTEAGVLNSSSGGTLICRSTFGAITKAAGDALTINWTVTIT